MNTKPVIIIAIATAFAAAVACTDVEPSKSQVLDQAKASEPTLTSTALEVSPPAVEKKEEPQLPIDDAKATVEPQSKEYEAVIESHEHLVIRRMLTASAIENREPVASMSTFGPDDGKVYAFVEASNESDADQSLFVHFIGPEGQVGGGIELRIPAKAPRWRTWAYTRHASKQPGLWRVEIRTLDGALVGALPFEVEAAF